MTNIEIGEILYIVLEDKKIIYPVVVFEEITKKTIKGTETDFIFKAGHGKSERILSYKDVEGNCFSTIGDAKQFLIDIEVREIEKQAAIALQKEKEWYGKEQ